MREALGNGVSLENSSATNAELTSAKLLGHRPRTFAQAFAVAAVLALWVAPPAPAQSAQPAQDANQSSAQSSTGSSQPQMVDQSAPAQDSLAEAARKAKAAKAKASGDSATTAANTTPKVYSNENLGSLSSRGVSYVGSGNTSSGGGSNYSGSANSNGAAAQGGNSGGGASGKNDETYWRGRAQEIRNQMADIDRQIERVQDDIAKNGAVTIDPQSGARSGVIMVEDRNAEIKRLQDKKADLQNSLDQLAEEGRKAGADSGWFR
jgi:hypothetical protein